MMLGIGVAMQMLMRRGSGVPFGVLCGVLVWLSV